ncbi:MAG: TlpA family protein disulfide reductase [Planctomycetota bacterium]|jgi:hypothetical protein
MSPNRYDRKLGELISKAIGREKPTFDFKKWQTDHQKEIQIFKSQTGQVPHSAWRTIMKSPITKLAAAAVIIIAVLIGIHQFTGSVESVAWASVAERFRSVPFFSATLYMKDNATAQPEQIELWMNQKGFVRLRYDNQVAFAKEGKITRVFDLKTRSEIEPDQRAVTLAHFMGDAEGFSLETVIRGISGGELVDVTPLVNTDAVISEDIVVFDVEHEKSPQWFRIWALRESKLPVRIRMWDPRDGECADALLTYSKQQQEIFFDPEAFSSKMKSLRNKKDVNLAYMYLKDPGGKQIFPGSLNESEVFKVVTQTIDGQPWSFADHRGKTVLINFWDNNNYNRNKSWLKEIYQEFGGRDDFIMVGVSLRKDAESTKSICKKQGISWLQLHEPDMGYKNNLARAFGVDNTSYTWLVWKDGTIDKLYHDPDIDTGRIEAAMIGFTYDSEIWVSQKLQQKQKLQGTLKAEDIIEICGDSYTVDYTPIGRKKWIYKAYNKDKSAVRTLFVEFKEDGSVAKWGGGRSLIDPATVTVSFSSEFLKERIESQVESEIYEKMYKDYQVGFSAKTGRLGFPFTRKSIKPGETYSRQLPPGTYDFGINIGPTNDFGTINKIIKRITLLKEIRLNKNETKTLRFE